MGEFVAYCNRRGGVWWRSVPRIGVGRARTMVDWLRRRADTIGQTADVDGVAIYPALPPTTMQHLLLLLTAVDHLNLTADLHLAGAQWVLQLAVLACCGGALVVLSRVLQMMQSGRPRRGRARALRRRDR